MVLICHITYRLKYNHCMVAMKAIEEWDENIGLKFERNSEFLFS